MNKNPWFRFYNDFIFDEKLEFLAFEDQRHYVFILCLKNMGLLDKEYPQPDMLDRVISKRLGIHGEALRYAKERLIEVGLIDSDWQPLAWDKRQFKSDSSSERTRKYRENKKKKESDAGETSQERHSDALDTETDTEKHNADFASFWESYPNKVNKKPAQKAWSKLNKTDRANAHTHLARFIASLPDYQKNPVKLHAATYLNNRRWEDEAQNAANDASTRDPAYARYYQ